MGIEQIWHPWRDARSRGHLSINFSRLVDDGLRGCIRGHAIQIDPDQLQAERRSTIAHELVHDERRVFPIDAHLRAREETTVEQIAARRLIALEQLADTLRWTRNVAEAADELWVDVPMLVALIRSLTDEEKRWLSEQLDDVAC